MQVRLKAYGEYGILAYGLKESQRTALGQTLQTGLPTECLEYVEGHDTLLFIFRVPTPIQVLRNWLGKVASLRSTSADSAILGHIREVPVRYDGVDLDFVARRTGLSKNEVIRIHSTPVYYVRMMGFSPGFPYLDGLDPRLQIARKDSPRKRVDPGSVAIGGPHTGIYSVASPGGWHLLGRTDLQLFDPEAAAGKTPDVDKVFLLAPGDRLRFQPID